MILSVPQMPGGRKAAHRRATILAPTVAATGGLVAGAALEYFLDPGAGRRRRQAARDHALSRVRRGERHALAQIRRAETHAGIARRTLNARRRHAEPVDDVTLAHRVESQLYRRAGVAKGQVERRRSAE